MNRNDIHNAVLEYIDLIENGRGGAEENLRSLELVLDKLALAHNFIEYQFDNTDYPDAPRKDYKRLRKLAEARFPDLAITIFQNASRKRLQSQGYVSVTL
jgi:hypothetical protein